MKHINIILFTILSFGIIHAQNTLPLVEVKGYLNIYRFPTRLITLHRHGCGAVDDGTDNEKSIYGYIMGTTTPLALTICLWAAGRLSKYFWNRQCFCRQSCG